MDRSTDRPHVVLGGNGVVGRETVRALLRRGLATTSVGRRPAVVPGATSLVADLLDPAAVQGALRGAGVAYLTAGLPYSSRVWREQWPVVVAHAIEASITHGTHLVLLDNVYAYGRVEGPMTEQTPLAPCSRKGEVRADALRALDEAVTRRGLVLTTGRSADFYGPGATTSAFSAFVVDRVARGRRATWLLDADQPHSLTHTPDIGEALAVLGTDPAARGRVWHLPTAPALTGAELVRLAAGPDARVAVMSRRTLRLGALFSTAAREALEMAYQQSAPYVVDSRAYEVAFGVSPTPLADGIAASLAAARATAAATTPAPGAEGA